MFSCSKVLFKQTKTFGKKIDSRWRCTFKVAKKHLKKSGSETKDHLFCTIYYHTYFNVWNEIEYCLDMIRAAKEAHIELW